MPTLHAPHSWDLDRLLDEAAKRLGEAGGDLRRALGAELGFLGKQRQVVFQNHDHALLLLGG